MTCGQFALLHTGEESLAGFCAATLAQLGEAQLDATRAVGALIREDSQRTNAGISSNGSERG